MKNRKAVACITYSRYQYFALVLPSILHQRICGRPLLEAYDLYLFQDGLWADDSEQNRSGHAQIAHAISNLDSRITVIRQSSNLGVALHFDFIEKFLFVEKAYDFVVFCEDDLILAPGYIDVVDRMGEKFGSDPRVGMVSAHPAACTTKIERQQAQKDRYAPMGHNWGFGLSKEFWQRRQPFVECYLELISGIPYRHRPHDQIFAWLQKCGFKAAATSQDYIKQCATFALGAVRLATFVNLGLPIGRTGLHCQPELFKRMGFDRAVVFNEPLGVVPNLDDAQFEAIYTAGGSQIGERNIMPSDGPSPFNREEWIRRLKAGEFRPQRSFQDVLNPVGSASVRRSWAAIDIPSQPHMEPQGRSLLAALLEQTRVYVEFGAGGSTVLAATSGVSEIHSVDSDTEFLDAVKARVLEESGRIVFEAHYVDIGPTKEWGWPIDSSKASQWPRYCQAPWKSLGARRSRPDLVLIDGRFRVACFLATLLNADFGTHVLFDDYFDRPHYHLVEAHLRPVERAGRLAHFIVGNNLDRERILSDLLSFVSRPD
jgi:hypothetical protein